MSREPALVTRVNIQLPIGLKQRAELLARQKGESLSAFLREGARERVGRLEQEMRDALLTEAYKALAEENRMLSQEHEPIDLEGWE
jgi:hypothetical protein